MITEEQREVTRILKQKAIRNKQQKETDKELKIRQEFRVRVDRMREIYIDLCDDEDTEPTKEGFIEFMYKDED